MRGMQYKDLTEILDFIYHGEKNIYQDNLDSFLAIAKELKLKGLTGGENKTEQDYEGFNPPKENPKQEPKEENKKDLEVFHNVEEFTDDIRGNYSETTVANPTYLYGGLKELDEHTKSLMHLSGSVLQMGERLQSVKCVERKETTQQYHIESKHIEGINNYCKKNIQVKRLSEKAYLQTT